MSGIGLQTYVAEVVVRRRSFAKEELNVGGKSTEESYL